jgi:hypothetical protein
VIGAGIGLVAMGVETKPGRTFNASALVGGVGFVAAEDSLAAIRSTHPGRNDYSRALTWREWETSR